MELFTGSQLLNLVTLTGLEIILGIDNIIFIAILVRHLQGKQRVRARVIGLSLALIIRVLMLFGATWIMTLTKPLFTIWYKNISGRDLLLLIGGIFLIIKAVMEVVDMFHAKKNDNNTESKEGKFIKIISQIIFIDIILSFDSIITAVGISDQFETMVIAVTIAMIIMLFASNPIGEFIYSNPSIKVVALAFVGLVGVMLTLNGLSIEFNKGYLYFAMLFSGIVEIINIRLRKHAK